MTSLIFKTASRFLLIITLIFSIWVLLRGHNSPGGGFIGGLISSSGFALYLLANGSDALRKIIRINLTSLLGSGLLLAMLSGLVALFQNKIFLTGIWTHFETLNLQIGTPIIFDIGVYIVVLSSVLIIMLALEESP